jgi:hypothetical protein
MRQFTLVCHVSSLKCFLRSAPVVTTVLAAVWAGAVQAGPLDIPNTFSAGRPAVAADVNENFSTVADAVTDNFGRIQVLQSELDSLKAMTRSLQNTLGVPSLAGDVSLGGSLVLGQYKGISLPTSSGTPFGISTGYQDYNGVRDDALYYGYNVGPNNRRMVAGEPSLIWNLEGNYSPRAGANWMEVNLDYRDASNTFWKRFLAFYLDRNSREPDGAWAMVGGEIRFENPINQEQFVFHSSKDDRRRTVFRYAGAARERLQIGYDGSWLAPDVMELGPSSQSTPELSLSKASGVADGQTALLIIWRNGQSLETSRVEVGMPDSAGAGYRSLRIAN